MVWVARGAHGTFPRVALRCGGLGPRLRPAGVRAAPFKVNGTGAAPVGWVRPDRQDKSMRYVMCAVDAKMKSLLI